MSYSYQGNATVQYFEHGRLVGSRRLYCCGAMQAGESFSAYWPHVAYVCPYCGEIWAREVYIYEFEYAPRIPEPWQIRTQPCAEHGGDIYQCLRLESASPELVRHIFTTLLKGYP
jgi:hypothetical protein